MSRNGQTHFKLEKSCSICCKIFKLCLTILGHYASKGQLEVSAVGKYLFKVNNKDTRTTSMDVVSVSLLLTVYIFCSICNQI